MLATCEQADSDGPLRLGARLLRPPGAVNRSRGEIGALQMQKDYRASRREKRDCPMIQQPAAMSAVLVERWVKAGCCGIDQDALAARIAELELRYGLRSAEWCGMTARRVERLPRAQ